MCQGAVWRRRADGVPATCRRGWWPWWAPTSGARDDRFGDDRQFGERRSWRARRRAENAPPTQAIRKTAPNAADGGRTPAEGVALDRVGALDPRPLGLSLGTVGLLTFALRSTHGSGRITAGPHSHRGRGAVNSRARLGRTSSTVAGAPIDPARTTECSFRCRHLALSYQRATHRHRPCRHNHHRPHAAVTSGARRVLGLGRDGVGSAGSTGWLAWRATLGAASVPILVLLIESSGWRRTGRPSPRPVGDDPHGAGRRPPTSRRYPARRCRRVGRTRARTCSATFATRYRDRPSVAAAPARRLRDGSCDGRRPASLGDRAARRCRLAHRRRPIERPSPLAVGFVIAAVVGTSIAHVALSGGRIRIGDRIRWSYSTIGELVARRDIDGVAPRSWMGTIATIVGINVAVALRGMSDRWTHGLPPMDAERGWSRWCAASSSPSVRSSRSRPRRHPNSPTPISWRAGSRSAPPGSQCWRRRCAWA